MLRKDSLRKCSQSVESAFARPFGVQSFFVFPPPPISSPTPKRRHPLGHIPSFPHSALLKVHSTSASSCRVSHPSSPLPLSFFLWHQNQISILLPFVMRRRRRKGGRRWWDEDNWKRKGGVRRQTRTPALRVKKKKGRGEKRYIQVESPRDGATDPFLELNNFFIFFYS